MFAMSFCVIANHRLHYSLIFIAFKILFNVLTFVRFWCIYWKKLQFILFFVTASNAYQSCFCLLFALVFFLVQILLNWCICCQILPFILFLVTISNHYYCFIFKHFCTLFKLVNFWLFLVHFFPRFSIKFYFWLSSITIVFIIFVNILQPLKLVVFLVIFGCIPNSNWLHFKYLFGVVLTNITTMLWIGNIIIPYFL